jgi:hypothetical protein
MIIGHKLFFRLLQCQLPRGKRFCIHVGFGHKKLWLELGTNLWAIVVNMHCITFRIFVFMYISFCIPIIQINGLMILKMDTFEN